MLRDVGMIHGNVTADDVVMRRKARLTQGLHTHTYTHTQTHTHRQTHTHTDRHIHTETDIYTHTDRHIHTQTDTPSHRQTHTHTLTHTHTDRHIQVYNKSTGQCSSGGATPGHARSNDLVGRSTTLALPCLALHIALLR